jgi:hypothetical protein
MARREVQLKVAFLGLVMLLLTSVAVGQILYGSLTGNISDASGAPIPGVKIEAANMGTGVATAGVTDAHGLFEIVNLQPGTYRVTISAHGFTTVIQEGVIVEANTTRRVDAQLEVARVNQKITVTAALEALQTDRTDEKTQMSTTEVASLPLGNDRNFQSIYVTVPTAAAPFASHSFAGNPTQSLALHVSGGLDTANITLIDGSIDTNFWEQNLIAYVPPEEAIEAINIVTTGFDAESGNANGSISNVTVKSGTNTLHGSAFEYNTDSYFQSRNFFTNQPGIKVPKYVLNDFGVSLGGPIKKNKLFFFGDWDRYRLSNLVSSVTSIPSQAMDQGNFQGAIAAGQNCATTPTAGCIYDPTTGTATGTGRTPFPNNIIPANVISKASSYLASLMPLPNYGPAPNTPVNNFFGSGDLLFHRDSVDLKINYVPTDKMMIFARYSAEPTYVFDPQVLNSNGGSAGGSAFGSVSQPGNAYGLTQNASVGMTYTFSPHLLFDANVGFTRPRYSAQSTDIQTVGNFNSVITGTDGPQQLQWGIPAISISSLAGMGNTAASNPFLFRDNQYTFAANLSWIKGSHNFRFGGDIDRYDMNRFQGQISVGVRGGFTFSGATTQLSGGPSNNEYNSWADFLLGLGHNMDKDYVYMNPGTTREWEFAAYARDNWNVTKKLSVNYGVRWEYYPIPTVSHFGSANFNWLTDTAYLGGAGGVPSNAYLTTGPGQVEPRVGIAYRLNDKTVIRTGAGMSSDPYALNYMAWIYPAIISQQYTGGNSYTPAGYLGPSTGPTGTWTGPTVPGGLVSGIPAITFPSLSQGSYTLPYYLGTYGYPNKYNRGYTEAWDIMIQHEFAHNLDAQIGYIGNHDVRLGTFINENAAAPGGGNNGTPDQAACTATPAPSFCNPTAANPLGGNANSMTINGPFTGGNYNALETQLTRRVAHTLLGTSFTWSKTIDDDDTEANTGVTWAFYQIFRRNRAVAGFDQKYNYQLYGVFDSPFGKGMKWANTGVGAALLGGWHLSPVLSRYSGTPFSVTTSGSSCNCPGNTQTADQIKPTVAILGGHGPNSPYFDPFAFSAVTATDTSNPTAVRFGTTGRNIVRGPGFFYLSVSVNRDFKLNERFTLQFRADCYGLPNNANFANPATTVSNATFSGGAVTNYGGYDIISGTQASSYAPYSPADRQLRFGLLLKF